MKITNYLSTFRKNNKLSAVVALAAILLVVVGCGGGKPEMPKDAEVQNLVKSTISDLSTGINSGDFKAFRDKASSDFQGQFTEAQVKTAFQQYIDNKSQVVPVLNSVSGMTAKFSETPSIREEKGNYILVANGSFDTSPVDTGFTSEYVWRDGSWKLLKIVLNLK